MRGYNVEQSVLLEEGSGWGVVVTKLLKQLKGQGQVAGLEAVRARQHSVHM